MKDFFSLEDLFLEDLFNFEDFFKWLYFKLFDGGQTWIIRDLLLVNGEKTSCVFYRRTGTYTVHPDPLRYYLKAAPEEKQAIEKDVQEMGYKLNIVSQIQFQDAP